MQVMAAILLLCVQGLNDKYQCCLTCIIGVSNFDCGELHIEIDHDRVMVANVTENVMTKIRNINSPNAVLNLHPFKEHITRFYVRAQSSQHILQGFGFFVILDCMFMALLFILNFDPGTYYRNLTFYEVTKV